MIFIQVSIDWSYENRLKGLPCLEILTQQSIDASTTINFSFIFDQKI